MHLGADDLTLGLLCAHACEVADARSARIEWAGRVLGTHGEPDPGPFPIEGPGRRITVPLDPDAGRLGGGTLVVCRVRAPRSPELDAAVVAVAHHASERLRQLRDDRALTDERHRRQSAEHRYRMLVEGSPVSIAVYRASDSRFVYANPQAVELYGARDREEMLSRFGHEVIPDEELKGWRHRVDHIVGGAVIRQATTRVRRFDGEIITVEVNAARVDLDGEACVQIELRDITARTRAQEQERARLEQELRTDPLTGVRNRRGWDRELAAHVAHAQRAHHPLTVAIFDLDRFKGFNDAHGHPAGDAVLQELTARWRRMMRTTDTLARLGGEEFAVALPGSPLDNALGMVSTLRAQVPGGLTCSAGLAEWDGIESVEDLVARADRALYEAKRAGRDCERVDAGTSESATRASTAPST